MELHVIHIDVESLSADVDDGPFVFWDEGIRQLREFKRDGGDSPGWKQILETNRSPSYLVIVGLESFVLVDTEEYRCLEDAAKDLISFL